MQVRTHNVLTLSGVAVLAALGLGTAFAQDKAAPKPTDPAKSAARANDQARRVPDFFGQIGLTPEQREDIYKARTKHTARIAELEKQIDQIRAEMLTECETFLTPAQKQILEARRRAAEERTTARAKSKSGTAPKPSDTDKAPKPAG